MPEFEKMGVFYLGRGYDPDSRETTDDLLLYDSRDLTTHAVCVGMTGSGKTGLCVSILEEAAMDGIPAIALDPKGDLSNLMLTFPGLTPEEFLPWIDPEDAARKGMTPEAYASVTAETWKQGLLQWGQTGERIAELRRRAEFRLYTPGGSAGIPLSVIHSLDAPASEVMDEPEALAERIETAVSGFLTLAGERNIEVHGRDHVLLSAIIGHAWSQGSDMSLEELIRSVQSPPMKTLGVLDVESFYPAQERMKLAMRLNSLAASPGFAPWTRGEPLNINGLLRSPDGRPRISILSLAHLSDEQRMFFVSLLLNEMVAWMRSLPGTGSLRAILYMDEIFGFFPPSAAPPSKRPMLTLLKQARAYGLGVLLATQNPVDLDYKGISNTGTWFIGRLQTERDKSRILEGLKGVSEKGFPLPELDRMISGLGKRVFLLHNVHEDRPVLFQTRWAMSYLAGPVTREQIKTLAGDSPVVQVPPKASAPVIPDGPAVQAQAPVAPSVIPSGIPSVFLPAPASVQAEYAPFLGAFARVHFSDAKRKFAETRNFAYAVEISEGPLPVDWENAFGIDVDPAGLSQGIPSPVMSEVASPGLDPKAYVRWGKDFLKWLPQNAMMTLMTCPSLKEVARPGESPSDFAARIALMKRELRDAEVEKIRRKYASKLTTLQNRLMRAEQAIEREAEQAKHKKMETAISFGTAIASALLGRKVNTYSASRVGTAVSKAARLQKESGDVARARETAGAVRQEIADLDARLEEEINAITTVGSPETEIQEEFIRPKASGMNLILLGLLWLPYSRDAQGGIAPLWGLQE